MPPGDEEQGDEERALLDSSSLALEANTPSNEEVAGEGGRMSADVLIKAMEMGSASEQGTGSGQGEQEIPMDTLNESRVIADGSTLNIPNT